MLLVALLIGAQAVPSDRLSVFKPFVGACWRTEFSPTVVDTHCFETLYDGAHVRDRHQVRDGGKTIYAGETVYSADRSDIVFTYINSLGGVGHGTARANGDAIEFVGTMRASPDQAQQPIDSEWHMLSPDSYDVRSLTKAGSTPPDKPLVFTRIK